MKRTMLLFVTLTVCFRLACSINCMNSAGISFIPCQNPGGSSHRGSGGSGDSGSQDNTIPIQPCVDTEYNGGPPQKYTVANQGAPAVFEIVFDDLNISDGEKLLIKSFRCDPNDCKIAVIDSTAATPLSVFINKYSFTLASASPSVSATFKVNYDCPPPGCVDFNDMMGTKKIKYLQGSYNFDGCFAECETAYSRMPKPTTMDEIESFTSPVWLGLKQTAPLNYTWNDGGSFAVLSGNGTIPPYGSISPWLNQMTGMWDKAGRDNRDCIVSDSAGWADYHCAEMKGCACECTQS